MEYPAKFTPDRTAGGFVVTFPDVPEAITQGDTIEEAMAMASEALELALTFYTEKWADLPVPGTLKRGGKIDLARRLKCSPSQVDRLLDISHHSKLDQMEAAFAAIGKRLAIEIRDAA